MFIKPGEHALYVCAFGEIDLNNRTLQGDRIPDDTWMRALRMFARGLLKDPYQYIGDWWAFNKQMGRI